MNVPYVKMGADPELFLKKGNQIVGCESIIPESGIKFSYCTVVRDGVQLELHPSPSASLSTVLYGIAYALKGLPTRMKDGIELCFDPVVRVTEAELGSLCESSRILGCQPSENLYGLKHIEVDPMKYLTRSAGGHIHIELSDIMKEFRERLVPIMDVLVAIPCILLDRNPLQVERRKLYGRAGEYRTPEHGLEYRTLSNFWLRSPALAEFVFGMTRMSVWVLLTTILGESNRETILLKNVDFRELVRTIQNNDTQGALDIYQKIVRPFVGGYVMDTSLPLHYTNYLNFEKLASRVEVEGLDAVMGKDIPQNWSEYLNGRTNWNTFFSKIV